jgi:hypothetical protein
LPGGELIQINAEWWHDRYLTHPLVVGGQAEMSEAQEDILPPVRRDTADGDDRQHNRELVRCEAEEERQIAEEHRITAEEVRKHAEAIRAAAAYILPELLATPRSQGGGRPVG